MDKNEKKLIEKLGAALELINASKEDRKLISDAKKIDAGFLNKAGEIFDNTEACTVCRHAFHSWRNTLDDETVISFIDDWINWKTQQNNPEADTATSNRN